MSLSKEVIIGIITVLISVGAVSAVVLYQQYASVQPMIKVHYMRNGQEIGSATGPLAVIGEHEGVTHIYFTITVKNTGEFPLTMYITGAEPSQFNTAVASATSTVIDIGQSHSWDSDLIDVSPFVDTTTTFTVHTKGEYTYAGETNTLVKDASVDLTVNSDPLGGYDVIIESSTGETGGGSATTVPGVTTVPQEPCWTVGTTCDPTTHNCCNLCEGTTTETREDLSSLLRYTTGNAATNYFDCPSTGYDSCELYKDGSVVDICLPGTQCYSSGGLATADWAAKGITTVTTYACT